MSSLLHSLTGLMAAVVVPIVAIVGGLSYAAYSTYLKVRRQREMLQMHHAERLAAIEKGIELPPLPSDAVHDQYYGPGYRSEYRRWRRGRGVTLMFVGAAVTAALWAQGGTNFWWGLIIIAWGLGQLVSELFEESGRGRQAGITSVPPGGNGGTGGPGSR